ncbi:MAG: hypothetical protein RLY93_09175 [Sumerlaeia bacterium]
MFRRPILAAAFSVLALAPALAQEGGVSSPDVPPVAERGEPAELPAPAPAPIVTPNAAPATDTLAPEAKPLTAEDFLRLLPGGQVPEELKKTLEIRNYEFLQPSDEDAYLTVDLPEVRLNVFNRRETGVAHFEIRTIFFRQNGTVIDATPWTRGTVEPRKSFHYRAAAHSRFAVREQVQMRLLRVE